MQGRPVGAGINGEARLMKSPLRYQISDYDCGPTSMLNAVSFLFEREQIPPELIRNIMLFSLDAFSPDGAFGKSGTSCTAITASYLWIRCVWWALTRRTRCRCISLAVATATWRW